MSTPDDEWWVVQAGEYVLGTLDYAERATFAKAIEHNARARQLVVDWENIFQPLVYTLEPMEPAGHVWDTINQRLFHAEHDSGGAKGTAITDLSERRAVAGDSEKNADRWRSFAGLATAASLLIATFAWMNPAQWRDSIPPATTTTLAQFNAITIIRNEQALPLWVVDTALQDGLVRVTAVAPPEIDDSNSYELWMVKPDNAGVQSMGILPQSADQSMVLNIETTTTNPVAFAVSLEPTGGSTEAVPTGPVLFQGEFKQLKL